jgi:histidinol phosphatase-like PHP family hydrolase
MSETRDLNAEASAWLRDMAAVQSSKQKSWGYSRAAEAIWLLDRPLEQLIGADGSLARIPMVGPSSTSIVLEVAATGRSATVERQVETSGKSADIERRRQLRHHFLSRAAVLRVLALDMPGITPAAYRGDFQMHSEWSDGALPVAGLAEACIARGYTHMAVTDHSHGLAIAGGMTPGEVKRQHREIDELNERLSGRFRVIKGVEANIGADGALDLEGDEVRQFELVLAAPHSQLRVASDQTARMLAALRTPGVHVLAHPRGRVVSARAGVQADWRRVFKEAAKRRIAVEIDGDPARQDLDYDLAAVALDCDCLFALDSDAHNAQELAYAEIAMAHARLAEIPVSRIINSWPVDRLLDWAASRQ